MQLNRVGHKLSVKGVWGLVRNLEFGPVSLVVVGFYP